MRNRDDGIEGRVMSANSTGFLESVDKNFRHSMTFLDLPEGLAERIIQCNSTYTVRFDVRLRGRMYSFIGWRSVHSEHSERVAFATYRMRMPKRWRRSLR